MAGSMANPPRSRKAGLWIKKIAPSFKKKRLFFFSKKNQKTFIYLFSCSSPDDPLRVLATSQLHSSAISGRSALASGVTM